MEQDFIINDGVLTQYIGEGGDVVIPEGVQSIGNKAFWCCRKMTSVTIPNSVTSIGDLAFTSCSSLTGVIIPDSVNSIGDEAFNLCDNLKSVIIPDSVNHLGHSAFGGCMRGALTVSDEGANRPGNFVIKGGLLSEYKGLGGDVVIPGEVTSIGDEAFAYSSVVSVKIPGTVKSIGWRAFWNCFNLEKVFVSKELTNLPSKSDFPYGVRFEFENGYAQTKEKLNALYTDDIKIENATDCAYIALYQTGKKWAEKVTTYMGLGTDITNTVIREMVRLLNDETDEKVIVNSIAPVITAIEVVDCEVFRSFYDAVYEKKVSKAIKLLIENQKAQSILLDVVNKGASNEQDKLNPIEKEVKTLWKINNTTKKLADIITKGIRYKDSDKVCSDQVLKYVIAEYAEELDGRERFVSEYKSGFVNTAFNENADRIADTLNHEDLQEVLERIALTENHWKDGYLIPFARFASPEQIKKLVADMNKWEKGGPRGRTAIIIARGGLMLSDTREAMMAVDKTGGLSYYASLRDKDPDVLRDTMLSNFGFNEKGEKTYDLGGNKVTVRVNDELQLTLYDNNAGKSVKSIPKKNAKQTLYDTAKTDFTDLKNNIRKVFTNRKKILFRAFLSGKEFTSEYWKEFYQGNPVLAAIARLLVWEQEDHFFTLSQGKTVDYQEQEYSLDNQKQIRLAYPTEMSAEEITGWQKYFVKNSLKQPFAQVWEPIHNPEDIKENRYSCCTLPVLRFNNKEEHGIWMDGLYSYSEDFSVRLKDCTLTCEPSVGRFVFGITDDAEFELQSFSVISFSRYANHIISLLDKWTIEDRIKKDDTSIVSSLLGSTIVQVKHYIEVAGQNNCTGCQAVLLDYLHQHFEAFDPLAEYLLEEE